MRRVLRTSAVVAALLGLAVCSNPYSPGQRALGGGLIGAGGGAAVAGLTGGDPATGALLGGAIGAVGCAITTPQRPYYGGYGPRRGYYRGW